MPPFCAEHIAVVCEEVDGSIHPRGGGAGKSEKELDLATRQIAWDGYALAAAQLVK